MIAEFHALECDDDEWQLRKEDWDAIDGEENTLIYLRHMRSGVWHGMLSHDVREHACSMAFSFTQDSP